MVLRCLLLALILPSFAWARDARSVRKEAAALVAEGKTVQAATLLGKALAAVQKKGDLVGQHDYYDALASVLAWQNRLAKPTADGAYRDCCFALMKPLDARRAGAFLSAHQLAGELLHQCVRNGDDRYLTEAVAVVAQYAGGKHRGAYAVALQALADGIVKARAAEHGKSLVPLTKALQLSIKNGWNVPGVYAAIELQAAMRKLKREKEFSALAHKLLDAIGKSGERYAAQLYRDAWRRRIGVMPGEIDARIREMEEAPGPRGEPGGRGHRALPRGTKVARALRKFSSKKPLVSARLGADGFDVRHEFSKFRAAQSMTSGTTYQADGGLTLTFRGPGVNVNNVDPSGGDGLAGANPVPAAWQFFYVLAEGETWSMTRRGEVSIK